MGNGEIVKLLIRAQADPTRKVNGRGLAEVARASGHNAILPLLLAETQRVELELRSRHQAEQGAAQLYGAAYIGDDRALTEALAQGADVGWRNPQGGATSLYVASEFGHASAVRLLIAAKADVRWSWGGVGRV